jgi:hypothetical protein
VNESLERSFWSPENSAETVRFDSSARDCQQRSLTIARPQTVITVMDLMNTTMDRMKIGVDTVITPRPAAARVSPATRIRVVRSTRTRDMDVIASQRRRGIQHRPSANPSASIAPDVRGVHPASFSTAARASAT